MAKFGKSYRVNVQFEVNAEFVKLDAVIVLVLLCLSLTYNNDFLVRWMVWVGWAVV